MGRHKGYNIGIVIRDYLLKHKIASPKQMWQDLKRLYPDFPNYRSFLYTLQTLEKLGLIREVPREEVLSKYGVYPGLAKKFYTVNRNRIEDKCWINPWKCLRTKTSKQIVQQEATKIVKEVEKETAKKPREPVYICYYGIFDSKTLLYVLEKGVGFVIVSDSDVNISEEGALEILVKGCICIPKHLHKVFKLELPNVKSVEEKSRSEVLKPYILECLAESPNEYAQLGRIVSQTPIYPGIYHIVLILPPREKNIVDAVKKALVDYQLLVQRILFDFMGTPPKLRMYVASR